MIASPIVSELIKTYEPFRSPAQNGVIGWGHRIVGEDEGVNFIGKISLAKADEVLDRDIYSANYHFNRVLNRLPVSFTQHEYDALVSLYMDYRIMESSFLLKAAMQKDYPKIEKEFLKWAAVAKPDRRKAESRLFITGSLTE